MNTISKASAVKSVEMMKKHRELRNVLINIPETFNCTKDVEQFIQAINLAASIEEQIEIIHTIFKSNKIMDEGKFDTLIWIYFHMFIKHPAKAVISNLFNHSRGNEQLVIEFLCANIGRMLEKAKVTGCSLEDVNLIVSELNECFQSFNIALEAIKLNLEPVLVLASRAMTEYVDEFKSSLSPALKNEIATYLHQVIQLIISCIKNYLLNCENKSERLVELYLNGIVRNAEELLDHPDLPVDSKANLGILLASKSKINNDDYAYNLILDKSNSPVKKMCLIIGVLCTMDVKYLDLSRMAEITILIGRLHGENSMDPAINLGVARYFLQTSKKLLMSKLTPDDLTEPQISDLFVTAEIALNFSMNLISWDHFMDSCRYLAKDCIKNITEFAAKYKWTNLKDSVFEHILKASTNNSKSLLISVISSTLTIQEITTKIPDVKQMLLRAIESSNSSTNQNILNSYEALMYNDKKNTQIIAEEWILAWIEPVILEIIHQQNNNKKKDILENLLKKCVKKDPSIVASIFKYKKDLDSGFFLLCLGAAKKNGLQNAKEDFIIYDEIQHLMLLADESIKLSALALVGESQKITEAFNPKEFECLLLFLEYNVNVQNPSVRQQILGIFKNIFERIEKSLIVLVRKKDEARIAYYYKFMGQLQDFCLQSLFDGANFTRKTLSLKLLKYVVIISHQSFPTKLDDLWNQKNWDMLEKNLEADTFETNKEITIELMMYIPKSIILRFSKLEIESTKELVKSIKPTGSISAAYQLEFIARFLPNAAISEFSLDECSKIQSEFYSIISWCEKLLAEAINCAEESLAKAASVNPIYGVILCIRHLLSKIDLSLISTCKLWCKLHDSIIKLCSRASAVVSPALICSAPEGFSIDTESDQEVLTNVACFEATPQMVLLCAWRTVKEVSLVFGDICISAPIKDDCTETGLITCREIIAIGEHFIWLLSQLKHRGAFEQAYVGYSKLCQRLYSAKEKELHGLPHKMLEQLLISISNDQNDNSEEVQMSNLCSTRRSAGLPFMIQALLTAELKIGSSNGLHFCMKNLIILCQNGKSLESRTHSLNILRALFRCTDLSESLAEHVSEALKCAVLGYSAESFIERNSSTLLFASLITRIFGVQRSKNVQNLLTGKVFFTRYPQLFDFIVDKLEQAMQFTWREGINGKPTNVVSILLFLLSRLYPSQNEACDSNFKLTKLVPLVSIFSGCPDQQIRMLSAKFIAVAIRPCDFFARIQIILKTLGKKVAFSANSVHGALLQILYLVRGTPLDEKFFELSQKSFMLEQLSDLSFFYAKQPILVSTILDVVLEVFARCLNDFENNSFVFDAFVMKFMLLINTDKKKNLISMKESNFVLVHFIKMKFDKSILNQFTELDREEFGLSFNYQQATLNILLLILDYENTAEMVEEYNIKPLELFFAKNLFGKDELDDIRSFLRNDDVLRAQMQKFTKDRSFYDTTVKSFDILCSLHQSSPLDPLEVNEMIRDSSSQPDSLKLVMFKYISACLTGFPSFKGIDYTFLLELSTDGSVALKIIIVEIIRLLLTNLHEIKTFDVLLILSRSIFNMLMDDAYEIRYEMSSIITNLHYKQDDAKTKVPVVPIYAQQLYLSLLTEQLGSSFECMDQLVLLLAILTNDRVAQDDFDYGADEYRVFDKNEANIFREDFKIKQDCLKAIKNLLHKHKIESQDMLENLQSLVRSKYMPLAAVIENYLTNNFLTDLQLL